MDHLTLLGLGWLGAAVLMVGLWWLQRRSGDAGIVDVGWSASLGILAVLYACLADGHPSRRALLVVLAGGWACRLASHLFQRVGRGEEDGRYQLLRHQWGARAQRNFFLLFQAQAVLAALFSAPLLAVAAAARAPDAWDIAGTFVILIAVAGEWIADRQLAQFRGSARNRGRTCRRGLWNFSRHPNYFCEWLHWCGYPLLAVGSPWFAAALVGPLFMLVFLFKITGIPRNETQALRSRGDGYREYQRETSVFFPWWPREP